MSKAKIKKTGANKKIFTIILETPLAKSLLYMMYPEEPPLLPIKIAVFLKYQEKYLINVEIFKSQSNISTASFRIIHISKYKSINLERR